MTTHFCLTVRFLQPYSHGRGEHGEPEWPPSPLRVFQALIAAAAARWNERLRLEHAAPALRWLEQLPAPTIIAPTGVPSDNAYLLYIPNNTADLLVPAWKHGEITKAVKREQKPVRPTHLRGDAVHYVFPLPDGSCPHLEVLSAAARSITHLGWGVDMVAGSAAVITDEEAAELSGERWQPAGTSIDRLRVPVDGALEMLAEKHTAFLNRLSRDNLEPVSSLSPLSAFRVVGYRRATDPAGRPWVAFRIASVDPDDPKNPAFDPPRRCRDVAAWVRSATDRVCTGWPFGPTDGFVHGHGPDRKPLTGDDADHRFMYLPLPSIERRGDRGEYVGSIRRVLIAAPPGAEDRIDWIRRRLPGHVLIDLNGREVGLLTEHTGSPWVLEQYTGSGRVWSTVTPVVLPGYDDPDHLRRRLRDNRDAAVQRRLLAQLNGRIEGLLRKALRHTGLADEVATAAELEWRSVGFRPGVDPARHYVRPENLGAFPAYHVRVRFVTPVPGPLVVGAGRYRGFGLFAIEDTPARRGR